MRIKFEKERIISRTRNRVKMKGKNFDTCNNLRPENKS